MTAERMGAIWRPTGLLPRMTQQAGYAVSLRVLRHCARDPSPRAVLQNTDRRAWFFVRDGGHDIRMDLATSQLLRRAVAR